MAATQRKTTHLSLQRAIAILRVFTEAEPELTVTEISRRLDIHKSTVSRILATLLDQGMVWHNPSTGRYSLGMTLVELAGIALGQIDVRAAALPHLESLEERVGETVSVKIQRGGEAVTVAYVATHKPVRHVVWIGRRTPLRTTASGKVFLASLHATGREWVSLAGADIFGPELDGWQESIAAELTRITEQGFASEVDEYEEGTSAIAAPILDATGIAVGAVSVGGPSFRFGLAERQRATGPLLETAAAIGRNLGVGVPTAGVHSP